MFLRAIAAAALSLPLCLGAHEPAEHAKKAASEAKASVVAAGAAVKDAAVEARDKVGAGAQAVAKEAQALGQQAKGAVDGAVAKAEAVVQSDPVQLLKENKDKHLHNKIVHFPIALGIFGCLFFLLSAKWASYLWPSRLLLASAAAFGALALPTGEAQEAAFDGTSLIKTLEAHQNAGKFALGFLLLTLLLSFFPSARKWSWIAPVLACACLVMAGAFGGILAGS